MMRATRRSAKARSAHMTVQNSPRANAITERINLLIGYPSTRTRTKPAAEAKAVTVAPRYWPDNRRWAHLAWFFRSKITLHTLTLNHIVNLAVDSCHGCYPGNSKNGSIPPSLL